MQDSPEPAPEREVIEVAPSKTAVAVTTPKLVYRVNGDGQDVPDMPAETIKTGIADFADRSIADEKGLVRRYLSTLEI